MCHHIFMLEHLENQDGRHIVLGNVNFFSQFPRTCGLEEGFLIFEVHVFMVHSIPTGTIPSRPPRPKE